MGPFALAHSDNNLVDRWPLATKYSVTKDNLPFDKKIANHLINVGLREGQGRLVAFNPPPITTFLLFLIFFSGRASCDDGRQTGYPQQWGSQI